MTLLDRARNALRGVRPRAETEGQRVTAQETGVMLGLMGEAQSAGAGMTDEQRLLLIQAMPGMRARETVLLSIPNRSTIEENELHMIRREMAVLEGRPVLEVRKDGGWSPKRFLGPLAAHPALALLASPWTWLAALAVFCGFQMLLKERIEDQRDEARLAVTRLENSRAAYARDLALERAAHAEDMAQVLNDTAATVEQLQRQATRRADREARERSRREDLARGSVDFTERLRELARPEGERLPAAGTSAAGDSATGSVPTEPGGDADDGANP